MDRSKVILCIAFLFSVFTWNNSNAQEEKEPPVTLTKIEGSGFTYEKVIDLPSVTKEQAYDRVKQWVLKNLKTVDNNTSFDDKGKDDINTSTVLLLDVNIMPTVQFKISFSFKDNKMKISASQFICQLTGAYGKPIYPFDNITTTWITKKARTHLYENFDERFTALIASVQAAASKDKSTW